MSKIAISGASTGTATFTIESPATSTNRTLTLPDNTGTIITQNSTPAFASTIGVGGATAAASGAGITFPATVSASSDANTLDDYEEGTWTPTASSATGSITSYTSDGTYTKVGDLVFVRGRVNLTNVGTAGGRLLMAGLPFTTATGIRPFIGVAREDSATGNTFLIYAEQNATDFNISALTSVGAITWTNNYSYIWSVTYKAA